MSYLWRDRRKLLTNYKKPSPNTFSIGPARCVSPNFIHNKNHCYVMDGTSLSIFLAGFTKAGMTVEAAIVLPLFLFFFLNLSCAVEMIRLHGNLELALWNTGNQLAVYGAVLDENEEFADIAFSYTYVKSAVKNYLGVEYLEQSPLYGGVNGLQFAESEMLTEDGTFEIITSYAVSPYSKWIGFMPFCMVNRYYGHLWTGYEIPGTEQAVEKEIVYMTENGKVYHDCMNCSHLRLTILSVTLPEAYQRKNDYGEGYRLCMACGSGVKNQETVWITSDGNRIHGSQACGGLRRTIRAVDKKQLKGVPPCSRCGTK